MIFVLNEAKKLLHRKSGAGHFEIVQSLFCFVPASGQLRDRAFPATKVLVSSS